MSKSYLTSVAAVYNDRSQKYDDSWHPAFARYMASRALASPSPLSKNPLLLDLACGTGLVTFAALELTPANARIYGVDLSKGMLDVARGKASALPSDQQARIQLIEHEMTDLSDIPELQGLRGRFDIITCASAFVLLSDPEKTIEEWSRWIMPGTGRLVLDVTHPHNLRAGVVMETVATKMGIQLPYKRAWMTGEQVFRGVVESGGFFEIEEVQLVEQTGAGTQLLDPGQEEADKQFEKLATTQAYEAMSDGEGTRGMAKRFFQQEWAAAANSDGKVEDKDGVYVIVARRK